MDRQRQHSPRANATAGGVRGGGGGGGSSGKSGGGKGGGGGKAAAGKKPIKVVYISNPMRVKTSAAGFRALVQELTGCNADPSKYSPRAVDDDNLEAAGEGDDGYCGAATHEESSGVAAAAAAPSPAAGDIAGSFDGGGIGGGCYGDDDDDDDIFRSQLLDTSYSVFSPPTLLYDHPHSKV